MRILVANDGFGSGGGVQSYLDAVVGGLAARGHELTMLYCDPLPDVMPPGAMHALPQLSVARDGREGVAAGVARFRPDICFSHNMRDLDVELQLLGAAPVVKFMHGYNGTCLSFQKRFAVPEAQPCDRRFGVACLVLYVPRRCGPLGLSACVRNFALARGQHALLTRYRTVVVASQHMKTEYVRNGVPEQNVQVNPLFATHPHTPAGPAAIPAPTVAFSGRMTALKGGDVLVRAVADASARLGAPIHLIMIGDGPQRRVWEALAADLRVVATFTGWQAGDARWEWLRRATLLAVPSTWPEPFGLVGLEAGALGVPAIAFDVGGVREWLTPGENGLLVAGDPPRASALADGLVAAFSDPASLAVLREKAPAAARRLSLARHLDALETTLQKAL